MSRDFDAVDDVVNLGTGNNISNLGSQTMVAWVDQQGTSENNIGYIFSKSEAGAGPRFFINDGNGAVSFGFNSATASAPLRISANAFAYAASIAGWSGYAGTWDGSMTATGIRIYKYVSPNNLIESPTYQTTTDGSTGEADNSALNFYIGNRGDGARTWNGLIAHFQYFNRVLDTKEIIQSFLFPGSITQGLVIFLPLYGSISPEPDYSGNKNNGTVTGATKGTTEPPINGIFQVPKPELITSF